MKTYRDNKGKIQLFEKKIKIFKILTNSSFDKRGV